MKNIKRIIVCLLSIALIACSEKNQTNDIESDKGTKVAIAYVTSWTSDIPKTDYITHVNYAFGHVSDSFDGIRVDNGDRLKEIVALRKQKPSLKILLSVGGWESGNFSEMAADKVYRESFAKDCKRVVDEFDLDGIDIDWEYPTQSVAGISSSPDDTKNFTLLMADIRKSIGKDKLLTIATDASGKYIDFKLAIQYLDFVNIMTYDMGVAPLHHSSLHQSEYATNWVDKSVKAHHAAGVPMEKLVMGVPFYGKPARGSTMPTRYYDLIALDDNYTTKWDNAGKVPYIVDKEGTYICGFDNPESIAIKAKYVLDNDMLGIMYWEYAGDDKDGSLQKAVYNNLNN